MKRDQISFSKNTKALLSIEIAVLFFSSISPAAGLSESLVLCKHDKVVRTLRVEIDQDHQCRTIYTKSGVDVTIGSGQYKKSCFEIAENVKNNLEEAKWNCREVKEARISNIKKDVD